MHTYTPHTRTHACTCTISYLVNVLAYQRNTVTCCFNELCCQMIIAYVLSLSECSLHALVSRGGDIFITYNKLIGFGLHVE